MKNMERIDHRKEFLKTLESIDYSRSPHEVFYDFLQMGKIALANAMYRSQKLEEQYFSFLDKYAKKNDEKRRRAYQKQFAKLLYHTVEALEENPEQDFLGELYMEVACFRGNNKGQFFTPYHLADMMSRIIESDAQQEIEETGCITFCEPTCGSGVMAIAFRNNLVNQQIFTTNSCLMQLTDLDKNCAAMAYVQLSLLGVPALVVHGDSLTQESWEQLFTVPFFLSRFALLSDPFAQCKKPRKKTTKLWRRLQAEKKRQGLA